MKTLFDPITIAGMKLKNRIVRSATYDGFSDQQGRPTARLYKVYEDLAKGGVGTISHSHRRHVRLPSCHSAECQPRQQPEGGDV